MTSRLSLTAALAAALLAGSAGAATETAPALTACRVDGLPNEVMCGHVSRALDPTEPQGRAIDIHFVVVPALARRKRPDPVFVLAGGPGQSAIAVAGAVLPLYGRVANRRDIVFVDQRGTGRSAPLACDDASRLPLERQADSVAQVDRLRRCADALQRLPYGDLRQFTTPIAMADLDAVRVRLGAERIDLVGGSYGTRAALDYLRQFPRHVRRVLIDGVAPPDMALPASMSADAQAALDAVFAACAADAAGCHRRYPLLHDEWRDLLAGLPRAVTVDDPLFGTPQTFTLTRSLLLQAVTAPLYAPALAAALPAAVHGAAQGRWQGLFGLAAALPERKATAIAEGMHFSVVCAEDLPRLGQADVPPGIDFGADRAALYRAVCAFWPKGEVPAAFYRVPPSPAPVLLLSGGLDPVTPPHHAERMAQALGAQARSVVVANAGHGVLGVPCMRDVLTRFIEADDDAQALAAGVACAQPPRPPAFVPIAAEALP